MKKFIEDSPYLYPTYMRDYKEPLFIRLIRGLFYKYVDELYIPDRAKISITYINNNKRGIRISCTGIGVQEKYFDLPGDYLKDIA